MLSRPFLYTRMECLSIRRGFRGKTVLPTALIERVSAVNLLFTGD